MAYLSNVAKRQPMLRMAAGVFLAFCCSMPLVWLLSNLVVNGLRAFTH